MKQPTADLPQQSSAAATENSVSAPEALAPAEKTAAKTAVKTAVKTTPKPSRKAAVKASGKSAAKATAARVLAPPVVANAAPANTPSPAPEAAEVSSTKAAKTAKPKKAKLIRDSFTMPEAEYNLIAEVKRRCLANGLAVKKSEVLRAAIIGFAALPDATIGAALQALEIIKTGRPPKGTK